MPKRPRRGWLAAERGADLIEMALVLPLLLLVVLGIVDFAFMFQRYEAVTNATREGARVAVLPGYTTPDVQSRVQSYLQTGGLPTTPGNPAVTVTPTTVGAGSNTWSATTVNVSYEHDYLLLGPIAGWFGGSFTSLTLTSQATMRNELGP